MFAGIVAAVGRIVSEKAYGDGVRIRIDTGSWPLDDVKIDADVSRATLDVTSGLAQGAPVNLERSLRLGDRIDGHLVSGHIDGVGRVVAVEELGGSARIVVEAPAPLARYIAAKGSVAIDGVSLTVNTVEGATFEVNLIPHTRAVTTFRTLAPGSAVNLEVDMLARYVERMLHGPKGA
jgi:riboflavin synthase